MSENPGFGIYIHWPFCLHICPYCDFNSHLKQSIDENAWKNAYTQAIDYWRNYRHGEKLTSVYFGGGTPSTCPTHIIEAILNKISKNWNLSNAEITLEANPTSVEAEKFEQYAKLGINRISIGFQAFNDADLKRLGRVHNVNESMQAYDIAKKYFSRNNFDLIYARQFQSLENWQYELQQVMQLEPSHISLYELTIEKRTRFGDMYDRGILRGLPSEDLAYEMYVWTSGFMRSLGFTHYEVSNFSKIGDESLHNLIYWNYGDYLGIGPGAHGRIKIGSQMATIQEMQPNDWLNNPRNFGVQKIHKFEAAEEYILMGLRIEEGISLSRLKEYEYELNFVNKNELIKNSLLIQDNSRLRATDKGRLVLNYIIDKLTA